MYRSERQGLVSRLQEGGSRRQPECCAQKREGKVGEESSNLWLPGSLAHLEYGRQGER